MRFAIYSASACIVSGLLLAGCASAPSTSSSDPKELFSKVCEIGRQTRAVSGAVWLKAQSKEASGQFPATVNAKAPDELTLEVNNLLGGTEAVIAVKDKKYSVRMTNKKSKAKPEDGMDSWGGIPLHWSTELFLGRIPCPTAALSELRMSAARDGQLMVETQPSVAGDGERFLYTFRSQGSSVWPESLHWERLGTMANTVDFKFEDPDDQEQSPKKWEAKSSRGEVKVRWRDRVVVR